MSSEEEMRSCIQDCIQEWMAQAYDIEGLARIYATITNETEKQLLYMAEQIKDEIVKNNN